jgi:hypothetical protein
MYFDDCHLLLKIMYTFGVTGPLQRVGSKGMRQPWQVGERASHLGSSTLGWDWTGQTFVSLEATIPQVIFSTSSTFE